MDGLQASPHRGREVRCYTANSRELRFGVVAAEADSGCILKCLPDPLAAMEASTGVLQQSRAPRRKGREHDKNPHQPAQLRMARSQARVGHCPKQHERAKAGGQQLNNEPICQAIGRRPCNKAAPTDENRPSEGQTGGHNESPSGGEPHQPPIRNLTHHRSCDGLAQHGSSSTNDTAGLGLMHGRGRYTLSVSTYWINPTWPNRRHLG